jgi:hypothetical protein
MAIVALIAIVSPFGCGGAPDSAPESEFACPAPGIVVAVNDLNHPSDCSTGSAIAEGQLHGRHYRKACREVAPDSALPESVTAARVTECRATEDRGVFMDVEVCCPEPVAVAPDRISGLTAEGPECPLWRTRTHARDLHFPLAESCSEAVSRAEGDLGIGHYGNACKRAAPRAPRPIGVLDARVVECRATEGTTGVTVDVEICCDAKVFDENEFKELVWQRPRDEVRAALGEPHQVTEEPSGTHWNYSFQVVRDRKVFPDVTLVFVDDRVESYHF